jgi:pimeloyl-ACP methyl ester carboxylesterase
MIRSFGAGAAILGCLAAAPLAAQGGALDQLPSHYAAWQGARVHYKSLGIGTTAVVFVHGWLSDLTVWRGQVPVVEGRVRAIFLDLPGFGRSDKPDLAYSMDYYAGAVDAVLRSAGVERAVLVGHSMGTPVIRQYYRKFPVKVAGLVFVDGALRSFFRDTVAARPFLARFEGPDYSKNVEGFLDSVSGASADSTLRIGLRRMALQTPKPVAVSAMRAQLDPAIWADDPVEVPALAVMAPNPGWTPEYVAYVRRLVPGIRYETIPGAGHYLMLEQPEQFNALLAEFLKARRLVR